MRLTCTDLLAKTGQGVGRVNGLVVFVLGPLPGERARIRITLTKAKYAVGELLELLADFARRARNRFVPFSDAAAAARSSISRIRRSCSGRPPCSRGAASYRRHDGAASWAFPIGMDDPRRYRNKTALVVAHDAGEARLGFYAAGPHELVEIDGVPRRFAGTRCARLPH